MATSVLVYNFKLQSHYSIELNIQYFSLLRMTTRTLDSCSLMLSLMGMQWAYPRTDTLHSSFFLSDSLLTSHFHSIMMATK